MGDKWETHVKSRGPERPELGDKCGRQVWETSVGDKCGRQVKDKCKTMRSRVPRVGDKCGGQVGDKCKTMRPRAPKVGEKHGKQVGDKCKIMRPRAPKVGEKHGKQVGDKCKSMRPRPPRVGQVGDRCKITRPRPPRVGNKWETSGRHIAFGVLAKHERICFDVLISNWDMEKVGAGKWYTSDEVTVDEVSGRYPKDLPLWYLYERALIAPLKNDMEVYLFGLFADYECYSVEFLQSIFRAVFCCRSDQHF